MYIIESFIRRDYNPYEDFVSKFLKSFYRSNSLRSLPSQENGKLRAYGIFQLRKMTFSIMNPLMEWSHKGSSVRLWNLGSSANDQK